MRPHHADGLAAQPAGHADAGEDGHVDGAAPWPVGRTDCSCNGMLDVGFDGGREVQDLLDGTSFRRGHSHHGGDPHGEGARLVEGHGVHAGEPLQRVAVADEDAEGGGPPTAHHHRHRRGQTHGTRTGHQEHGDGAEHGRTQVRADDPPAQERDGGHEQHDRHEHRTHPVGEAFEGRLLAQGIVDHVLESGQDRLGDHRPHFDDEDPRPVARAARDQASRAVLDGQGFARQHRLVDSRPALDDLAVQRERLTGEDPDPSPDRDRLGWHDPVGVASPAVAGDQARRRGPEGEQGVQCPTSAGARPRLDGSTGDDDGDDERCHGAVEPGGEGATPAEVEMSTAEGNRLHRAHRQRSQRAQRDECVHARRTVT